MKSVDALIREWNEMPTGYMERLAKLGDMVNILAQLTEHNTDASNQFFREKFREWNENPSYLFKLIEGIIARKDARFYESLDYFFRNTGVSKWWGYSDDQRIEEGNTRQREEFDRLQKLFEAHRS
jgi:hypothetical protein